MILKHHIGGVSYQIEKSLLWRFDTIQDDIEIRALEETFEDLTNEREQIRKLFYRLLSTANIVLTSVKS